MEEDKVKLAIILAGGMLLLVIIMFIGANFFINALTKNDKEEAKKRGLKKYGFWRGEEDK